MRPMATIPSASVGPAGLRVSHGTTALALLTLPEFVALMSHVRITVAPPHDVRPCTCGDMNCLGWRIVTRAEVA